MAKWKFEPGHTAAEFSVRHMMATNVRGHFKNIVGALEFDSQAPSACKVEVTIDAKQIWTGDSERDAHLRSADFLDVEGYPEIRFKGGEVKLTGQNDCTVSDELTIKGIRHEQVSLHEPR